MILRPAGASPPLNQGPATFSPAREFAPSGHRVFSHLRISGHTVPGLRDLVRGLEQERLEPAIGKAAVEIKERAVLGAARECPNGLPERRFQSKLPPPYGTAAGRQRKMGAGWVRSLLPKVKMEEIALSGVLESIVIIYISTRCVGLGQPPCGAGARLRRRENWQFNLIAFSRVGYRIRLPHARGIVGSRR
jgi:hypothetical protein